VANVRYPGKALGAACDPNAAETCADKTLIQYALKCLDDPGNALDRTCQIDKSWKYGGMACSYDDECVEKSCVNSLCVPKSADNSSCAKTEDCSITHFCSEAPGSPKTCRPVLASGAACNLAENNPEEQCPAHHYCRDNGSGTTGTCAILYTGAAGSVCQNREECAQAYCNGNSCANAPTPTPLASLPACTAGSTCPAGSTCVCDENTGSEKCFTGAQEDAEKAFRELPPSCYGRRDAFVTCVTSNAASCLNVPEFTPGCCFNELGAIEGCALTARTAAYNPGVKCEINTAGGEEAEDDATRGVASVVVAGACAATALLA
jgi:hypothetical protein